ncbi:RNA polymerase sigma-70 factor (ECF subfamily) [Larkinella arboricola]|uniref:RNA polymerase sigma-70 factor (ECF subfamily) n=1 Tax=Larkinella arboricola TaxID=643671 RepID=A0A327WXZ6_LARAB|nr:sigma-70 family RNA polymerase sigma factor [Larkinella arboricola]RAJ97676.1 RNA polymerase sigma-70 factor (ECF subfamily) [Larkinella arboricola]
MQQVPLSNSESKEDDLLRSAVNRFATPQGKVTDDELIFRELFAQDPKRGCELLFRRYYANLVNHAVRFVYSKDVAEDLVAEVYTVFWQDRIFERITTSYRAYLYQTVRNRAYNYLRWELHPADPLETLTTQGASAAQQPDEILHFSELHQKIEDAIQGLSPQCKRAFLLSRVDGKKYPEIAQEMQISGSAVEKLMIRALSHLRQELKRHRLLSLLVGIIICPF